MTGQRRVRGAVPFQWSGSAYTVASMNSIQSPHRHRQAVDLELRHLHRCAASARCHRRTPPRGCPSRTGRPPRAPCRDPPPPARPEARAASGSTLRARPASASAASSRCAAARAGRPAPRATSHRPRSARGWLERPLAHGGHVVAHLAAAQVGERAAAGARRLIGVVDRGVVGAQQVEPARRPAQPEVLERRDVAEVPGQGAHQAAVDAVEVLVADVPTSQRVRSRVSSSTVGRVPAPSRGGVFTRAGAR